MKKYIITLFSALILASPMLAIAAAEPDDNGFLNDKTIDVLQKFQKESGFKSLGGQINEDSIDKPGIDNLSGFIFTVVDIMKYAVGTLAILFLTISIIRMIAAGSDGSEEAFGTLKKSIIYTIIAVVIIISSDFFFKKVFVVADGNFLASKNTAMQFARLGSSEIIGIYNVIEAFLAVIAVLMLVMAAFRMVSNAGSDDVTEKAKKQVMYAVGGLILVALSEFVVKDVLFVDAGTTISVDNAKLIFVKLTNFASGFMATAAVVSFFYAGYLYISSAAGDDNAEKVKKIIMGGIIGLLVAAGAFAIVNTVIKLDAPDSPDLLQNQLDTIR